MEMTRVVKGLEEQIDSFEKQKLHDVKSILLDFITIELCFHTKAVELLTKGFQDISDIDEVKDLQVISYDRWVVFFYYRDTLPQTCNFLRIIFLTEY